MGILMSAGAVKTPPTLDHLTLFPQFISLFAFASIGPITKKVDERCDDIFLCAEAP